jgi:hypothetical protein
MEHHRANQFLKTATNLNFVQPKLFQPTRQDDHCFSDCTVFVIQILDDADVVFRISDAEFADVLGFYPRPPCSQVSRTASTGELSRSDLVRWHFASFRCRAAIALLWEQSGRPFRCVTPPGL